MGPNIALQRKMVGFHIQTLCTYGDSERMEESRGTKLELGPHLALQILYLLLVKHEGPILTYEKVFAFVANHHWASGVIFNKQWGHLPQMGAFKMRRVQQNTVH